MLIDLLNPDAVRHCADLDAMEKVGAEIDWKSKRFRIEHGDGLLPDLILGAMNPYLNIMFAALHPARPTEAITREQAVEAYTRGSAYAEFAEDDKGTIAEGKQADLTILSQDIFAAPLSELPQTRSVLTVVGGRIAYDAKVVNLSEHK